MKRMDPKDLRDVVLVGHAGAGKTSLGEAILYDTRAVTRLGSVVDGTSNLDTEPEEIRRKITIRSHLACVEWKKSRLNLLDTPGEPDFGVDAHLAATAADAGLLVVSAPDGVQVGTEKGWHLCDELALPRAIVVNKLDRERADFDAAVAACREKLSDKIVPLHLPLGVESDFTGIVDVLAMKCWRFPGDGRDAAASDVPAEMRDAAKAAREKLVEAIASADDSLIEKYLETGELSEEQIAVGLPRAVASRTVVPVLCASAALNAGVQPLLDFIVVALPSPASRAPAKGTDPAGGETERPCADAAPLSARVFKTLIADIGRVNVMRVMSGVLTADTNVFNATHSSRERIGQIYALVGRKRETTPEAGPGDIVAVAKLKDTHTGDTLCDEKAPIFYRPYETPRPVMSYAIHPKSKSDEDKLAAKLGEVIEEDPALRVVRDPESHETLLSGMGTIHLEVEVEKLRRLGADVDLSPPRVPYRETVKGRAQNVEGKHKKQTGGRGQFGVCYVHMEPMPRGAGFEFADEIFGGAIPRQFIPAIEKGIRDRMTKGVVAGFPVVDVKVSLVDGKYHDVDSDSRSFEIAGSRAFQAAFRAARPILLEPIVKLAVTVPSESMGDVMGDISSRRGRVEGMEAGEAGHEVIKAHIPLAEVLRYAADLRSMTGGRGSFTVEPSHYEEVPSHLADKIIAEAKVAAEEE